jgi:hypothetical protein
MPPIAVAVPLLPFHHSSLNFNTETALWVDGFALTLTIERTPKVVATISDSVRLARLVWMSCSDNSKYGIRRESWPLMISVVREAE